MAFKPSTPIVYNDGNKLKASDATNYQWFRNNELLIGETNQDITPAGPGAYVVQVKNEQCSSSSEPYHFSALSISDNTGITGLEVYPNPFVGAVSIEAPIAGVYQLTDVSGRIVASGKVNQGLNTILTNSLNNGVYQLHLELGQLPIQLIKLVK